MIKGTSFSYAILLLVFLGSCNTQSNKEQTSSPTTEKSKPSIKEYYKNAVKKNLSLLFELPIDSNGLLTATRDDNGEYPNDFVQNGNRFYILSAEEQKIIVYDKNTKQLSTLDTIRKVMLQQIRKDEDGILWPTSISLTNNFIVVGYDNFYLVFNNSQQLLYRLDCQQYNMYQTIKNDTLYVWSHDFLQKFILKGSSFSQQEIIYPFKMEAVDYELLTDNNTSNTIGNDYCYHINGSTISEQDIIAPYDIASDIDRDDCILYGATKNYYIWYPTKLGRYLFMIDRHGSAHKVIDIGKNISKNSLAYFEDPKGGIKMLVSGSSLYILIMVKEQGVKKLKVYELPNID